MNTKKRPWKIYFLTDFIRTLLCTLLDSGIGKCHQSQTWRYQEATVPLPLFLTNSYHFMLIVFMKCSHHAYFFKRPILLFNIVVYPLCSSYLKVLYLCFDINLVTITTVVKEKHSSDDTKSHKYDTRRLVCDDDSGMTSLLGLWMCDPGASRSEFILWIYWLQFSICL